MCLFLLGASAGVAGAIFNQSGDYTYYADNPFGTYYRAQWNYLVWTNVDGPGDETMQTLVDAKSKRDGMCANPAPAPAGFNKVALQVESQVSSGAAFFCGNTPIFGNSGGSNVARINAYWSGPGMASAYGSRVWAWAGTSGSRSRLQ